MAVSISEMYYVHTGKRYLYNIMPLGNIPSVIRDGILSYNAVKEKLHDSVAMADVQSRRDRIIIPKTGKGLHSYANLYFTHHNAMLFRLQNMADELAILAVSIDVLDLDGCIVTDRNAAASMAMFYEPIEGIKKIQFDLVFAKYWVHGDDHYLTMSHKQIKCAEVLVPERIPFEYIAGAVVLSESVRERMRCDGFNKSIHVSPEKFYRGGT